MIQESVNHRLASMVEDKSHTVHLLLDGYESFNNVENQSKQKIVAR